MPVIIDNNIHLNDQNQETQMAKFANKSGLSKLTGESFSPLFFYDDDDVVLLFASLVFSHVYLIGVPKTCCAEMIYIERSLFV